MRQRYIKKRIPWIRHGVKAEEKKQKKKKTKRYKKNESR
jgi:hypothetical protein